MQKGNSGIEQLNEQLYSRDHPPALRERRHLRPDTKPVPESWETISEIEHTAEQARKKIASMPNPAKRSRSLLSLLLAGSFLFFSLSAVFAGYLFYKDANVVSAENIDIEVTGPLSIAGGEELVLQLAITNRNSAPIQAATLIIDYPEGTRTADEERRPLQRVREDIGVIESGASKKLTTRAALFGEEGATKEITLAVEYRVSGSNAIFFKENTYTAILSSAPVALIVETLKEVTSGKEVVFTTRVTSNSSSVIRGIVLAAEYPPGFTYTSAQPAPSSGTSLWRVGDLLPGESKDIIVRGLISGQEGEARVFRFKTGIAGREQADSIDSVFASNETSVSIKRPFLNLALSLNRESGTNDFIIAPNEGISANISIRNMLPDMVHDVEITAKLYGSAYNPRRVTSQSGFFRSQTNSVIWNRETTPTLAKLSANKAENVSFTFYPQHRDSNASIKNGELFLEISAKGRRISETNVPEIIESTIVRRVIVGTRVAITGSTLFSAGPFQNTGPVPPRVAEKTTYTLVLKITNSSNDVRDVLVRTRIPWYVEWLGLVSPQGVDVSYNEATGAVVWRVGQVPAGAGYDRGALEVAFQVALEPSFGQLGQTPRLLYNQALEGVDVHTGATVEAIGAELSTILKQDPVYSQETRSGIVSE